MNDSRPTTPEAKPRPPGTPKLTPGQAAAVAFRNSMRGRDHLGNELPLWSGMTDDERAAWEKAAKEAATTYWGQL